MKKILLVLLMLPVLQSAYAQTTEEIFKQRKTMRKHNLKQIAELLIQKGYVSKAYEIMQGGWDNVFSLKTAANLLDIDFFNSFKNVRSNIGTLNRVGEILTYQVKIVQSYKTAYKKFQDSGRFDQAELKYMYAVYSKLLKECQNNLDNLEMVITSNRLEMTDEERIKKVEELYLDFQDKYQFISYFNNQGDQINIGRLKEKNNTEAVTSAYGVNE